MGGFALTGVAMGAVVGVGVDGFGENEEGEVPKGGGAKGVGVGVGVGVREPISVTLCFFPRWLPGVVPKCQNQVVPGS